MEAGAEAEAMEEPRGLVNLLSYSTRTACSPLSINHQSSKSPEDVPTGQSVGHGSSIEVPSPR